VSFLKIDCILGGNSTVVACSLPSTLIKLLSSCLKRLQSDCEFLWEAPALVCQFEMWSLNVRVYVFPSPLPTRRNPVTCFGNVGVRVPGSADRVYEFRLQGKWLVICSLGISVVFVESSSFCS